MKRNKEFIMICGLSRFISGDVRADEIPGLLGMHTLFIREHNRIAAEFRRARPELDDEEVFQRSRRINVAQFQHIIYNQYLPILLGKQNLFTFP